MTPMYPRVVSMRHHTCRHRTIRVHSCAPPTTMIDDTLSGGRYAAWAAQTPLLQRWSNNQMAHDEQMLHGSTRVDAMRRSGTTAPAPACHAICTASVRGTRANIASPLLFVGRPLHATLPHGARACSITMGATDNRTVQRAFGARNQYHL